MGNSMRGGKRLGLPEVEEGRAWPWGEATGPMAMQTSISAGLFSEGLQMIGLDIADREKMALAPYWKSQLSLQSSHACVYRQCGLTESHLDMVHRETRAWGSKDLEQDQQKLTTWGKTISD
jgi:hypothetical protein